MAHLVADVFVTCFQGTKIVSTGTPQGCALSPLLYTVFIYDGVPSKSNTSIIKFADNTTIVRPITCEEDTPYRQEVAQLVSWCLENNLSLNAEKTKEMIVDPRMRRDQHAPTTHQWDSGGEGEDLQIPHGFLRKLR